MKVRKNLDSIALSFDQSKMTENKDWLIKIVLCVYVNLQIGLPLTKPVLYSILEVLIVKYACWFYRRDVVKPMLL